MITLPHSKFWSAHKSKISFDQQLSLSKRKTPKIHKQAPFKLPSILVPWIILNNAKTLLIIQKYPYSSSIIMEERSICISDFLEARSQDIVGFKRALDTKMSQLNKLPCQLVPKHLRRRAMSHNRYRVPSRIRKNMNLAELDATENAQRIARCRKHIRKPKLLAASYRRRSLKNKWLETHLWHAKRMRMINYFG